MSYAGFVNKNGKKTQKYEVTSYVKAIILIAKHSNSMITYRKIGFCRPAALNIMK